MVWADGDRVVRDGMLGHKALEVGAQRGSSLVF